MTAAVPPGLPPTPESSTRTRATWFLVAITLVGGALVVVPIAGTRTALPQSIPLGTLLLATDAFILLGCALACRRAILAGSNAAGPYAAAMAAGFAFGWLATPATEDRGSELGLLVALVAATTVSLALRVTAPGTIYARMLGLIPLWTGACGALILGFLALEWPAASAAAAVVACTPMALRALPAVSISVPSEQLLDHSILMRLRWAVRTPIPAAPQRINAHEVTALVRAGRLQHAAGTVFWCLAAVLGAWILIVWGGQSRPERIAIWVLGGCLVAFLLLSPRRSRAALDRWAPRFAALAVLAGYALVWCPRALPGSAALVPWVLIGVALLIAVTVLPVAAGASSLGVSRFGDVLEGLAAFLVVPAGFVAGGYLELFRGLVS